MSKDYRFYENDQQNYGNSSVGEKREKHKRTKRRLTLKKENRPKKPTQRSPLQGHEVSLERARRSSDPVEIMFLDGESMSAVIKFYDKYTVTVATVDEQDEIVIFKHALKHVMLPAYKDFEIVENGSE